MQWMKRLMGFAAAVMACVIVFGLAPAAFARDGIIELTPEQAAIFMSGSVEDVRRTSRPVSGIRRHRRAAAAPAKPRFFCRNAQFAHAEATVVMPGGESLLVRLEEVMLQPGDTVWGFWTQYKAAGGVLDFMRYAGVVKRENAQVRNIDRICAGYTLIVPTWPGTKKVTEDVSDGGTAETVQSAADAAGWDMLAGMRRETGWQPAVSGTGLLRAANWQHEREAAMQLADTEKERRALELWWRRILFGCAVGGVMLTVGGMLAARWIRRRFDQIAEIQRSCAVEMHRIRRAAEQALAATEDAAPDAFAAATPAQAYAAEIESLRERLAEYERYAKPFTMPDRLQDDYLPVVTYPIVGYKQKGTKEVPVASVRCGTLIDWDNVVSHANKCHACRAAGRKEKETIEEAVVV